MSQFDTLTVTISIRPIELIVLKKLSLVSHALAGRLSFGASQEQEVLAKTLDDLIRQIEIKAVSK